MRPGERPRPDPADGAARAALRAAQPLTFRYDPGLPISARREDLLALLREHQVLIVAGETGSGKSTQLPQYCLEIGRGLEGQIAHTQPRRLAARALAARIAEELGQAVGNTVGYRVRFADQASAATRLVLMTDGLLMAELAGDPLLSRYDTVIVDEAHERSLNVDLLLGVLRGLLGRRPELKLIVTSATLEVERMAQFFGNAPIVRVSGRSFPIEVRHRDGADGDSETDLPAAVLEACREIETEPGDVGSGDVLVFLPGEREIADVGELLERELGASVDVVPLYSRLAWDQQSKIFQRGSRRRIVLATNVAETSITVPGIRSVIDSGLARVSRYSVRSRLQRLPIEPVSRASADQRKGRCGRLGPGLCLRLYSEEDFAARPPFTEPEILRTNLAALLLRLAADGLGAAERFPFIDPPDTRALNDGYRLLQELDALDDERRITRRGRAMARLPLDPRLARALLESKRFRAEAELLAITAVLSVPDPRIAQQGGDAEESVEAAAFEDPKSEFTAMVKLWRAYRKAREGPRRELRRWCAERRLSLLRLSEWDNVYSQVKERAAELGITAKPQTASYTAVHRALLAGFATMIGVRGEEGVYLGTRGVRFHLFPGSPVRKRKPRWVMAANIVETSRVFARRLAEIEPSWIEAAAPHLIKREYLEPDWSEAREEVVARERTSFLGLILRNDRIVNYGPIAPEAARQLFAREAIVFQRLTRRPPWLLENDAALRDAQAVEERLRTRDLVATPESLVEFYDQALPRQVSSAATLENFTRNLGERGREALRLPPERLFLRTPDASLLAQFPLRLEILVPGLRLAVRAEYRFAPGEAEDGVRLVLPLLALPVLTRSVLDAAIPGLVLPKVDALLRSLPKEARRHLIPVAATAAAFVAATDTACTDPIVLGAWLQAQRGLPGSLVRFDASVVPDHLTPHLAVADAGREPVRGMDLAALRRATAEAARAVLERLAAEAHPEPWRRFEAQVLPSDITLELPGDEGSITVHPGLRVTAQGTVPRYEWSAAEADRLHARGTVELAHRLLERQVRDLARRVAADTPLLLAASPYLRGAELAEVLVRLALRRACFGDRPAPRDRDAFDAALEAGRAGLFDALAEISKAASGWFGDARAVRALLDGARLGPQAAAAEESATHLRRLLAGEALMTTPADWLGQLPRYLRAEQRRWQRIAARGTEAPAVLRELQAWTERQAALELELQRERRWMPALEELHWDVEEYRVSLYAQDLKTLRPVSAARLTVRAAQIEDWLRR
jgi:ATP-dependent helicase HrpA